MRYLKWIFLGILFCCLIITVCMCFSSMEKATKEDVFNISDIYDISWYRVGIKIYEYDQLVSENNQLNDNRYMIFDSNGVLFCNSITDECKQYNYSYDNGVIIIDSEDYFVTNGTYNIKLNDDQLELIVKADDIDVVYCFERPVG